MPSAFFRFGSTLVAHARLVIACWLAIAILSAFLLPRFEASLTGPPLLVDGSESARAQALIDDEFDRPFAEQDLIVFESETLTAGDPAFQAVVQDAIDRVSSLPLVVSVVGPSDSRAVDQVSAEGHVAAAVVFLSGSNAERQRLVSELTAAAAVAATDDVRVYVTGRSPLITELVVQERSDLARAEQLGLPVALIILLIASRTLVAAALPILLALLGGVVTFGVMGAISGLMTFNLFVPNVATMIGLGVGIDYSLFIIHRYREGLTHSATPAEAVAGAVATAGKTVFFSGVTVILSLSGLLLVNAQIFRELAVGAITFDQRGVGMSSTLDDSYCLDAYLADIEAIRTSLGFERWHVFGHSWGGILAQLYAWTYPDRVLSLFLCNAAVGVGGDWRRMRRAVVGHVLRTVRTCNAAAMALSYVGTWLPGRAGAVSTQWFHQHMWRIGFPDPSHATPPERLWLGGVNRHALRQTHRAALSAANDTLPAVWREPPFPVLTLYGSMDIFGDTSRIVCNRFPTGRKIYLDDVAHYPWIQATGAFEQVLRDFYSPGAFPAPGESALEEPEFNAWRQAAT